MAEKAEWALEYDSDHNEFFIIHEIHDTDCRIPCWYQYIEVPIFSCNKCGKKAPDHYILQWKIATGK